MAGFSHVGDLRPLEPAVFSRSGPQDGTESEAYPLRRAGRVLGCHVKTRQAVLADATLTVYLDEVAVGTAVIPTGERAADAAFDPNSGYYGSDVTVAWTANPPSSGCTILVDVV